MIWYASYGSNLDRTRFRHYLEGGRPEGADLATPGARDDSPPADERAVTLPGEMFFGWHSPTWGGGVSFHDPLAAGETLARAYLLTQEQFADVAAQEMHRPPGEDLDLTRVLEQRRHSYGPGRYETLHLVGELEGVPMVTFTADHPSRLPPNAPTEPYLRVVARGLVDTHGLTPADAAAYLLGCRGLDRGEHAWSPESLAELLGTTDL